MQTLTNQEAECNSATAQAEKFNIILGAHRLRDCTLDEVIAMALNGSGYVRRGNELTLFSSEAFEQWELS